MNERTVSKDHEPRLLSMGATLQQFWALVQYARDTKNDHRTAQEKKTEQQKILRMVERLESALRWDLISQDAQGSSGGSDCPGLTKLGGDLLKLLTGFFDDFLALERTAAKHGRTIRIASSTTLLHWLVLPAIKEITRELSEMPGAFSPELSFKQVERNEVAAGLTMRAFHFAIMRHAKDIEATPMNGSITDILSELKRWADADNEAFEKIWQASPYVHENPHGHMRLSVELGSYGHRLCVRKDLWKSLKQQTRNTDKKWNQLASVALCTNHQAFRDTLLRVELEEALHVTVRTDTWIESAQLAQHGNYATVLPTLAFAAHPDFMSIGDVGFKFPAEPVMLLVNPSNLKNKEFRQALYAIAMTLHEALKVMTATVKAADSAK